MTAETLHDAIGLLPADLIAEADRVRNRKKRIIPWTRYAAMAASFALVLSCGLFAMRLFAPKGATETAAQAPAAAAPLAPVMDEAPAEEVMEDASVHEEAAPEEAHATNKVTGTGKTEAVLRDASNIICHRVETPVKPTTVSFSSQSVVKLITSRKELVTYLTEKDWIYDFTDAREVCNAFDEAWFADHDLLLLTVMAADPDFPYAVTAIENISKTDPMGWDWAVLFSTEAEDHPEGETTTFHLLTEVEKGLISPEDSILTVADPEGTAP